MVAPFTLRANMKARIFIILLGLSALVGALGQGANTLEVDQFSGSTVGANVTACAPSLPCVLVIPSSLSAYSVGLMPVICARCSILDYRKGAGAAEDTRPVSAFGAVCNGVADETATFQAAANWAQSVYAATGNPATVTFSGTCPISGVVSYGSGVHWQGNGTVLVPTQTGFTFQAVNADNVAWDNVDITVNTSDGGDNAAHSAIYYTATDSAAHSGVYVRNCHITNSEWGIYISYNQGGTGSLSDVQIQGNTVGQSAVYYNGDGIHVGGRISNLTIEGNRIFNRGDACIGVSSEGSGAYILAGLNIHGNVCTNDRVGIDVSGATDGEITGNFVKATTGAGGFPILPIVKSGTTVIHRTSTRKAITSRMARAGNLRQ